MKNNFAGISDEFSDPDTARIYLQSIPYDGTSTWGKGANKGFRAMLDAAENMELYDIDTDSEVYKQGIHIPSELGGWNSPEDMFQLTYENTKSLFAQGKFLTFFGGEHSISIGIIKAFYEHYANLTVLQLDAHADLRSSYEGTPYNHACALYDASLHTNLVQVGIRSADITERSALKKSAVFYADQMGQNMDWQHSSIRQMTDQIYITLDLDVLDPSIMPSTGTPEPGGLDWYTLTNYLKRVFSEKEVVGFDIVELAPIKGLKSPQFLAAKLYYKMLSYKFHLKHEK
jgi:agmatinase